MIPISYLSYRIPTASRISKQHVLLPPQEKAKPITTSIQAITNIGQEQGPILPCQMDNS